MVKTTDCQSCHSLNEKLWKQPKKNLSFFSLKLVDKIFSVLVVPHKAWKNSNLQDNED
jgi:hypothetical protein